MTKGTPMPPSTSGGGTAATRPVGACLAVLLAILMVVAAVVNDVGGPAAAAEPTLGRLAAAKGRYFGSATDNPELSNAPYVALLGREFNQTTPGNSMKWDATEPQRGQFSYAGGDEIVSLAQRNGQLLRGHTLVWHSQLPGWVSGGGFSATELRILQNHVTNVATHYRGKVAHWDVVNEPLNEDGTFRNSVFYQTLGQSYIADALRAARAADPNARLYINDYNTDGLGAKSDGMYDLVRSLKQQGAATSIGFNGAHTGSNPAPTAFTVNGVACGTG
jgi:endo-1,4-beta-xylanase